MRSFGTVIAVDWLLNCQSPRVLGRYGQLSIFRNKLLNTIRRARTFAHPVVDAPNVHLESALFACGDRVEKTHLLQRRAALALTAVSDDKMIKGLLFAATTGQPNRNHGS